MNKYYGGEDDLIDEIKKLSERLQQVDEWHPTSEPPKQEDFEPTRMLQVWRGVSDHVSQDENWRQDFKDWVVTHWRKVTPPKP